jgi:MarR family transcriptional regulator for hemolysin
MSIENDAKSTRSQSFGWHIQQLAAALDREMKAQLEPLGLNQAQFVILMKLLEIGPSTQTKLAQYSSMPVYKMSREIDRLEASDHLRREAHPSSRRAHLIHLTQLGKDIAPTLFSIVQKVNARCADGFCDADIAKMRISVAQMTLNLNS